MLLKAEGSTIIEFPYNLHDLFEAHPNTTFPRPMSDDVLESYGIYRVQHQFIEEEVNTKTHKIEYADTPVLIDGVWTLEVSVVAYTEEEVALHAEQRGNNLRITRDELLAETDWWAVSDRTMTAEQTAYRQALRDLSTHANWPDLEDADWPTKPE